MAGGDRGAEVRAMLGELAPGVTFGDGYGIEIAEHDLFDGRLRSVDRIAELVASRAEWWS